MKHKIKVQPLHLAATGLILINIIILFIASSNSFRDTGFHPDYQEFSAGWRNEFNEMVELSKLSESCIIHKKIPAMDSDEVLFFNARNLDVNVFIDDICIYEYHKSSNPFLKFLYGKTTGSDFVEVPILRENSGRTFYIYVNSPYNNKKTCKIVNMYFGDGVSIVKHEASVQLGTFCFSILILFVGIVCLLLYVPLQKLNMIDSSLLYLGLSAFSLGMSMLCDSKMLHLVVGHETLYYTISQLFMIIIPVPMILFFDRLYGGLNKILITIICCLTMTDFFVILFLNAFDIRDYNDNVIFMLLNFLLVIIYIGFITISRIIKKDRINLYHNIGVIMLAVTTVLDMVITRNSAFFDTSFFTRFGIAGFMSMECIQVLWKHMDNYQKALKTQLISRLAYHDGLTDLLNRTSFKEDMERFEKENNTNRLIAVFDINDLKHVNDNFGHLAGDELIMNIAESIQKAFGAIGNCYRTGGDEFIYISTCENSELNFIHACETLNSLVKEVDKSAAYPVSVAIGHAIMNAGINSLNDLLDAADEKMYENKRKMKAG